jgi:hypothetical protein
VSRKSLLACAALVVAANAIVLLGVTRDRASPIQTIDLTERELPPAFFDINDLSLTVKDLSNPADIPSWFDEAKLRELGFPQAALVPDSFVVPSFLNGALGSFSSRWPPRPAYIALEYDGPAWQAIEAQTPAPLDPKAPVEVLESHLVPVDVSRSSGALLAKYGRTGKHLIVRATVEPWVLPLDGISSGKYIARGHIVDILGSVIHISEPPSSLKDIGPRPFWSSGGPRYTVRLASGSRFEPWIVAISALPR